MGRMEPQLIRIEHDHAITPETDREFLHALKQGLLMALRERGILNDLQLRIALERLEGNA